MKKTFDQYLSLMESDKCAYSFLDLLLDQSNVEDAGLWDQTNVEDAGLLEMIALHGL